MSQQNLPDQPFTDQSIMPFGIHRGKAMANVPAVYLLWLHNEGCFDDKVRKYIINNLDALNQEVSKIQKR